MGDTFVLEEREEGSFSVIPADTILEAEIESVKKIVKPFTDDNGDPVRRVEFAFRIIDDNFHGRKVWGDTPTTFTTHPDCKLRAWVQEALAVSELPKSFTFNTDSLQGEKVRVVVGVREWVKDGETQQRNFVTDVLRSRDANSLPVNEFSDDPF